MRIVILGGGEIGFALAQALAARHHAVFVVDHKPEVADRFQPLDVQFLLGSGTSHDVLVRAGVEGADVVVACTGLDEVNIVGCAVARQIAKPRTICFVSRDDFLQGGTEARGLAGFGIDRVIWPEAQLAAEMERIIREPGALDAETFADGAIRLVEYRLEAGSPFIGRVADLHLPHNALMVAVRRPDAFFIPRGASTLAAGDKVLVMGSPEALREVRRRLTGKPDPDQQRVTIVGGGDVGLRLAERLERDASGLQLTLVERDAARGAMIAGRLRHTLVLNGDGTDLELLEAEDVGRSDVLVGVIDNDERNLFACLLARQLGVRRIITRVGKRANLRLFERVGIDIAISARGAAVASVLHQIQGDTTRLLAVVEEGAGRILELDVPPAYAPRALRDLAPPLNSIVGAIVRPSGAFVPRGNDRVEPGDRIIVFTTYEAADQVRTYFTKA
ncbi:MAG: Trk system potassium transporter TrkA [Acidobacteriota bacterium]